MTTLVTSSGRCYYLHLRVNDLPDVPHYLVTELGLKHQLTITEHLQVV